MIHGELVELGETKLVTEKLKEQVRSLTLMVKKEEAKQEFISDEIHQTQKLIHDVHMKFQMNDLALSRAETLKDENRAKTQHNSRR